MRQLLSGFDLQLPLTWPHAQGGHAYCAVSFMRATGPQQAQRRRTLASERSAVFVGLCGSDSSLVRVGSADRSPCGRAVAA